MLVDKHAPFMEIIKNNRHFNRLRVKTQNMYLFTIKKFLIWIKRTPEPFELSKFKINT